jgi:RNA-directed DNA polymerase
MANTKAPRNQRELDLESESWRKLPWRKLEQHVYHIQKRIFKAESNGNHRAVHKLQKLLLKSRAARLLAVRRVTQDNQGKKTAGVDGVKSVPPKQRLVMTESIHPKYWKHLSTRPVRRIYIPKPGKKEKRPLGIPVMETRAHQALVKLALEPEWETKFEPNSYGFRPGRSCHDAIEAIFTDICQQPKYVLDADIKGAFDHIRHEELLRKLDTYPSIRRVVKQWLKAGAIESGVFEPTEAGTPQGGVLSPLLMNIALHGMEEAVRSIYQTKRQQPHFVRYADDLVVLHPTEEGVQKAQEVIETWLQGIGLELKPSKTKITHTTSGFEFLGFAIQQVRVGKTHRGKRSNGEPLAFKTFIKPSKEAVKRHKEEVRTIIENNRNAPQEKLIQELNPVIRGWTNYYRTVVASQTFSSCRMALFRKLEYWARRRHPNKSMHWIMNKYWHVEEGKGWHFRTKNGLQLRQHTDTKIRRHIKVRGTASPYDGNLLYWSQRLSSGPVLSGTMALLLKKQQGKCRWCELLFRDGDQREIDHILPKHLGGGEELSNKCALHRHCHDQRHANSPGRFGVNDNDQKTEEPCEATSFTHGSEAERRGRPLRLG